MGELIREWSEGGFRLEIVDEHRFGTKTMLSYRFYDEVFGEEPIFDASDFGPSPMDPIDSDMCVGSLLGFLSMRPGDVDAEYFEGYSERQMEWVDLRAEELSIHALCLLGELG